MVTSSPMTVTQIACLPSWTAMYDQNRCITPPPGGTFAQRRLRRMSMPVQLSIGVQSYAADDPGTWEPLFEQARIADQAGVDRLVVSDHVVFGERLEEYGRPEIGGSAGGQQPARPRGARAGTPPTPSVVPGAAAQKPASTQTLGP